MKLCTWLYVILAVVTSLFGGNSEVHEMQATAFYAFAIGATILCGLYGQEMKDT
jgi:Mg2+ and Co2+ transporter CorA